MTSFLYHDWLKHFDQHFNFSNRKVLLLVDNCSAHGSQETAPKLEKGRAVLFATKYYI